MYKNENQFNFINISKTHKIEIAANNCYQNGELHPNRVMKCHDMFIVVDGKWDVIQNDTLYELEKFDVIFLAANNHHMGNSACLPGTKTIFIHIENEEGDFLGESSDNEQLIKFPVKISCKCNPEILSYFENIVTIYWSKNPNKDILITANLNLIFHTLSTIYKREKKTYGSMLNQMIEYINKNLNRFISLDELANLLYLSKRSILSIFKKKLNTTPHQYQLDLKLNLCYSRLEKESDVLIKNLAYDFGFTDEYHLSKKFKDKFGVSPKVIKNMANNK